MANMVKYKESDMAGVLRHNYREVTNGSYGNEDIKTERREFNMSFSPELGRVKGKRYKAAIQRYKERRNEVEASSRKDLVTMAEWDVSLPKEIWDMTEAINKGEEFPQGETLKEVENFFSHTAQFLTERYGEKNVLGIEIHFDEGRRVPLQETGWDGNPKYERSPSGKTLPVWQKDENGKVITVQGYGQPHLHFDFMPITQPTDGSKERFCAKEILNRNELKSFHQDLNRYLKEHGVKGEVLNGATAGYNFTVEQLKSGMKEEMDRLMSRDRTRSWKN